MDTLDASTTTHPPQEPPPAGPSRGDRLRRSKNRRLLGGVAGGLAERFDVDVSLVRVAFVVLAFAWGVGAIVYLAMWALVPVDRSGGALDDDASEPSPTWLGYLLLAGVLVFGLIVASSWWGGPRWGGGLGLLWVVLLVVLLVAALRGPGRGVTLGRVLAILALTAVTFAIVAAGAFLSLVAWSGVPLTGGIGDRVYQPATIAQVRPAYRAAVGDLTVDLRRVQFAGHTVHVTASVAVGMVTVEVPPGVVVDVTAHSGVGNVVSSPGDLQSFASPARAVAGHPQLVLVAEAGVGQVRLIRAPAGDAYPFT